MKWDILNIPGKDKIDFGTVIMLSFLPILIELNYNLF
jgi:hypothetical protein